MNDMYKQKIYTITYIYIYMHTIQIMCIYIYIYNEYHDDEGENKFNDIMVANYLN